MVVRFRNVVLVLILFAIPALVFAKARYQIDSEIADAKQQESEMLEAVVLERMVSQRVRLIEEERKARRQERSDKLRSEVEAFGALSEPERKAFLDRKIEEMDEAARHREDQDLASLLNSLDMHVPAQLSTQHGKSEHGPDPVHGIGIRRDMRRQLAQYRRALHQRRQQRRSAKNS